MAAEAACSKGDLPVLTVEARLVAVTGLAAAAVTAVVPTELATAVLLLPSAARGATQPDKINPAKRIKYGANRGAKRGAKSEAK